MDWAFLPGIAVKPSSAQIVLAALFVATPAGGSGDLQGRSEAVAPEVGSVMAYAGVGGQNEMMRSDIHVWEGTTWQKRDS